LATWVYRQKVTAEAQDLTAAGSDFAMGANAFCNVIRNFVNSDSGPRHATVAAVVKISLTIILEVLFLGKLQLGVVGTMFALGLAGAGSALVCALHFYGQRQYFQLRFSRLSLGKDLQTIFPGWPTVRLSKI
jgi:Na+-driven multidrug efflux pump